MPRGTLHGIRKRPGVRERVAVFMRAPAAANVRMPAPAAREEAVQDIGLGNYVLVRRHAPRTGYWGAREFIGIDYDICKRNRPSGRTARRGKPFGDAKDLTPQPDDNGRWDLSVWLRCGDGRLHTTYHRLVGLTLLKCMKGIRGQAVSPFRVPPQHWHKFHVHHKDGDPYNCSLGNLEVLYKRYHEKLVQAWARGY